MPEGILVKKGKVRMQGKTGLIVSTLFQIIGNFKEMIVIESNATGQMANLITSETGFIVKNRILKFDGRPLTPQYIIDNLSLEA